MEFQLPAIFGGELQDLNSDVKLQNVCKIQLLGAEMCLKPTLKIAFCDDDPDDFLILRATLEDAGYRDAICACAFSGKELLDALCGSDGNLPDVILLDISMPAMDGLETLERIRRDAKYQSIPVLLMSGSPEYAEAVLKNYLHLTIDGILTKPISIDSLTNLLKPYRHCF
jgi:CheY-like chemotaxis protein